MSSLSRRPSGRWQATVRDPGGGRLSRTFATRGEALRWADLTETRYRRGEASDGSYGDLTVTHTLGGLVIHVPSDLLTMEMAAELEHSVRDIVSRAGA